MCESDNIKESGKEEQIISQENETGAPLRHGAEETEHSQISSSEYLFKTSSFSQKKKGRAGAFWITSQVQVTENKNPSQGQVESLVQLKSDLKVEFRHRSPHPWNQACLRVGLTWEDPGWKQISAEHNRQLLGRDVRPSPASFDSVDTGFSPHGSTDSGGGEETWAKSQCRWAHKD